MSFHTITRSNRNVRGLGDAAKNCVVSTSIIGAIAAGIGSIFSTPEGGYGEGAEEAAQRERDRTGRSVTGAMSTGADAITTICEAYRNTDAANTEVEDVTYMNQPYSMAGGGISTTAALLIGGGALALVAVIVALK